MGTLESDFCRCFQFPCDVCYLTTDKSTKARCLTVHSFQTSNWVTVDHFFWIGAAIIPHELTCQNRYCAFGRIDQRATTQLNACESVKWNAFRIKNIKHKTINTLYSALSLAQFSIINHISWNSDMNHFIGHIRIQIQKM